MSSSMSSSISNSNNMIQTNVNTKPKCENECKYETNFIGSCNVCKSNNLCINCTYICEYCKCKICKNCNLTRKLNGYSWSNCNCE